jgi:hypothetical protein
VAKQLFESTVRGVEMVIEAAPVVAQRLEQGLTELQRAREERKLLDRQHQLEMHYYQAQLAEREMMRMQMQGFSGGIPPPPRQDRFGDPFSQNAARGAMSQGPLPPAYSEGSMPRPHRMQDRAPPYQRPLQSEGSMASASASSAAPSQQRGLLGFIDNSRRRQGLPARRDPYQQSGAGKPKGKTLIHVPAPVLEYFDVKNDPYMMKP